MHQRESVAITAFFCILIPRLAYLHNYLIEN